MLFFGVVDGRAFCWVLRRYNHSNGGCAAAVLGERGLVEGCGELLLEALVCFIGVGVYRGGKCEYDVALYWGLDRAGRGGVGCRRKGGVRGWGGRLLLLGSRRLLMASSWCCFGRPLFCFGSTVG